ncbi:MAG: flagellar hook-associated family protein [Roseiarcus sp.]|jgi:flagellar hook-associated protein 3 FlgL
MSASFVSTSYLGTALLPSIAQTQSQLTALEVESSTGQYADLGLQLGDQSGYELSLKNQNELMQTLTSGNGLVTTSLKTSQTALDSIRSSAQSVTQSLTSWTSTEVNSGATLQSVGANALQSLIATANSTANGQYVFGGINSSVAPIADYFSSTTSAAKTAIDAAFQTAFGCLPTDPAASAITASQMQSFLSGAFANEFSGANWTGNWSSASSVNTSAQIAPGETIDTSTNANQSGFQQLAQGYTMLAEFGGSQLSSAAQQAVASAANSMITQGTTSITETEAGVGATLQRVTDANSSMSSQMTILETQIGNLDNVDSAAIATKLNTLSTQLQTAYQLTAQLQKLSLAQYIPT